MLKKLVSYLIVVATIISSITVANAEKTEVSKNDRAFNTVVGLGIIDSESEITANLTRAEFAHVLCNLCGTAKLNVSASVPCEEWMILFLFAVMEECISLNSVLPTCRAEFKTNIFFENFSKTSVDASLERLHVYSK